VEYVERKEGLILELVGKLKRKVREQVR